MSKYYCDICHESFTREWNLKRHKIDVHKVIENDKNYNLKQVFKENLKDVPFKSNSFDEQTADPLYNQPQQNSYSYNNNFYAPPFYNGYNNIQSFPTPYIQSPITETKSFSNDDKIRIQKKLKTVENILIKVFPKFVVVSKIKRLRDQCYEEQSDEPLKRYIVKKNLGHLWPD
jgi:hypothetical protein